MAPGSRGNAHREHAPQQQAGEREMAELIGTELQLEAVGGLALGPATSARRC